MNLTEKNFNDAHNELDVQKKNLHRRTFMRYTGVALAGASVLSLADCKKDYTNPSGSGVSFGTGDYSILNFAYALEQLEAAFYTQVMATPFSGMSVSENNLLSNIRDHEIAHREFFKAALGTYAIPALSVNFASINFTSRDSVLNTAKAFEDLGVSAYNGAGRYIADANYLLIAGKIVSVEARHAAYIRDLISYNSFADSTILDGNGMDTARKPSAVIAIASAYITTSLDVSTLPA